MSRIIEEPKQHIHQALMDEINEMSIRLKVHHNSGQIITEDQQAKLFEARKRHLKPDFGELAKLLDRCYSEMNQCTKPYKVY